MNDEKAIRNEAKAMVELVTCAWPWTLACVQLLCSDGDSGSVAMEIQQDLQ